MQYVQNVFSWLNDVFLEMTWLSDLITWIVNNIFRLCDMHNIPIATNLATAEVLIHGLDRGDLDWREMYK